MITVMHILLWVYILIVSITIWRVDDAEKQTDEINKRIMFKNYTPFIDCTSEIYNTQID